LPYGVTETELRNHFSKYNATSVRIVEGRGFGFVDIDGDQMQSAIGEMHKKDLMGRPINVNEAQPKNNGGGSGNQGGYGSGGYGGRR
jgi:RNA recognition motif-containing protein